MFQPYILVCLRFRHLRLQNSYVLLVSKPSRTAYYAHWYEPKLGGRALYPRHILTGCIFLRLEANCSLPIYLDFLVHVLIAFPKPIAGLCRQKTSAMKNFTTMNFLFISDVFISCENGPIPPKSLHLVVSIRFWLINVTEAKYRLLWQVLTISTVARTLRQVK